VTLTLLWTEYREQYPDGYGHSQFCELYRRWAKKLNPPAHSGEFVHRFRLIAASAERRSTGMVIIN
jgi:transposase